LRQSSEGHPSVVEQVLRAQARYRPLWWATPAAALLLLAVFAGFRPASAHSPGGEAAPTATVTGYIAPCAGLPFPLKTSTGARLFSAAATVEALRGREHEKPVGDGVSQTVFPAAVAARERVTQNQKFRFDHLAPGHYVIWARYAQGNVVTSLDVSLAAGKIVNVDLPNTCR
jgi:hypothetical protein